MISIFQGIRIDGNDSPFVFRHKENSKWKMNETRKRSMEPVGTSRAIRKSLSCDHINVRGVFTIHTRSRIADGKLHYRQKRTLIDSQLSIASAVRSNATDLIAFVLLKSANEHFPKIVEKNPPEAIWRWQSSRKSNGKMFECVAHGSDGNSG